MAWADICAAQLATWGVGPDVNPIGIYVGDLILGVILQYMVSTSFSCFLWLVKGLGSSYESGPKAPDQFQRYSVHMYLCTSYIMHVLCTIRSPMCIVYISVTRSTRTD